MKRDITIKPRPKKGEQDDITYRYRGNAGICCMFFTQTSNHVDRSRMHVEQQIMMTGCFCNGLYYTAQGVLSIAR